MFTCKKRTIVKRFIIWQSDFVLLVIYFGDEEKMHKNDINGMCSSWFSIRLMN